MFIAVLPLTANSGKTGNTETMIFGPAHLVHRPKAEVRTQHHAPTFFDLAGSVARATACGTLRTRKLGPALAASADFRNS